MADNLLARLKKVNDQIEESKREYDRLSGRREQLVTTLKDKFGVETVKDAQAMLDKMNVDVSACRKELEGMIESMEKILDGSSNKSE